MINNSRFVLALALAIACCACEPKARHPGAFQSVIEFDERELGFEVGGRVTAVKVQRGTSVHPHDLLATLDDKLERTARDSREAKAQAAKADVAVVRAGSRPEEVRSMQAQLRAAEANEALIEKNLTRERALLAKGAVASASVDDLESRLRAATAERESIEQRLRELRNGSRRQEIDRAEAQAVVAGQDAKLGDERLGLYELYATEEGTVLDVHVEPNEVVGAGSPVVTVDDPKHTFADVFVPEGDLGGVRIGGRGKASVDATPQVFDARIENIGRKTEFTPRYLFSERERVNLVVRVRVRIDDPSEQLHAGVPAFITLERQGAPSDPARP